MQAEVRRTVVEVALATATLLIQGFVGAAVIESSC